MTCHQIEQQLRAEISGLSYADLIAVAVEMGVAVDHADTREEIIDNCVAAELYAFTH